MIMGMPIIVQIEDEFVKEQDFEQVFQYLNYVENKFSVYKKDSEISKINDGKITKQVYSEDVNCIFELARKTKQETNGYFDILTPKGSIDPSGVVKGWAIYKASKILEENSFENFCVYAGGDIQTKGFFKNNKWKIGIQNPFDAQKIVKSVSLSGEGIATSGNYVRGNHIYNPLSPNKQISDIASVTIIGPNVLEADRFATAIFAMGENGINFLEKNQFLEGYVIDKNGMATMTSGFQKYVDEV